MIRQLRSLALAGAVACLPGADGRGGQDAGPEPGVLLERLAAQEDAAEGVAQVFDGLAASALQHDMAGVRETLAADVAGGAFPDQATTEKPLAPWVRVHGWTAAPRGTGRRGVADGFIAFLGHFPVIDDVGIAVLAADFDLAAPVPQGTARVSLALVGRDASGRREWARGEARASVRRVGSRWLVASLDVERLESEVATREVFEDVSLPARVRLPARLPRLPGNVGGVWHGAAAADFDGDGWIDVVATSRLGLVLFLNEHGERFREAALGAGLRAPSAPADAARPAPLLPPGLDLGAGQSPGGRGLSAPLALDYDNDGDLDLFVSAVGRQRLFENRLVPDGTLAFRDVSETAGVAVEALGFGVAAADVDGDGLTDVYVACYNEFGRAHPDAWLSASNGTPSLFFRNLGHGRFHEEAARWGIASGRWSLAPLFLDVDGDGRQDLYVANDFGENTLFMNEGGQFTDEARARGVLDPGDGMGAATGDFDRDGRLDLLVTNMSSARASRVLARAGGTAIDRGGTPLVKTAAGNSLFAGLPGGAFRDVTAEAGPFPAGWAWGGGFVDVDNDGWDDIFTPNGYVSGLSRRDTASQFWQHVVAPYVDPTDRGMAAATLQGRLMFEQRYSFNGFERDAVYLNLGNGRFRDVSGISGADSPTDGRGAVFADFDNDGDADLFLTTHEGPGVLLFRNALGQANGSVRIVLEPAAGKARDAFGAVVRLDTTEGPVTRVKNGGSGFLAQHDPRLLFGLGGQARARSATVAWPNGVRETFTGDFARGRTLLLKEGTGKAASVVVPVGRLPDPPTPRERRAAAVRLEAGAPVPAIVLLGADGAVVPLRSLLQPGRRLLVLVWKASCTACSKELAALQKAAPGLAARGIDAIALNVDGDPAVDTAGALRAAGVSLPAWSGRLAAHEQLFAGDDALVPLSFLVSAEGSVLELGGDAGWRAFSAPGAR